MRAAWRYLLPSARGWELGWLVLLQAVAAVFLAYPLLDEYDGFLLWEGLFERFILGLSPGRMAIETSHLGNFYQTEAIQEFYYDPKQPLASGFLVVGLYLYFYGAILLMTLPLAWAWVSLPWRAFGWDALALVAILFLYSLYLESLVVAAHAEESMMADAMHEWLYRNLEPVLNALATAYLVLGLWYGHLGRLLFARKKKPPPHELAA